MSASVSANAPVIVIDLQTGLIDGVAEPPLHRAREVIENARRVIAWARRSGRPLAFIRHDGPAGDSLAPGGPGWAIWPALGQAEGEPTFGKSVADAFSNPKLGAFVGDADEVVLLGAQTDYCVAGTVQGALARGLKVTVVADAHSTVDQPGEPAADVIARHNRTFAEEGVQVIPTDDLVR